MYAQRQLTVAQVAERLATTPTLVYASLHEHGIPVRGSAARCEDEAVAVIDALYADRQVAEILDRHRVPRRPMPGTLAARFSRPVPLTEPLLRELYCGCGLSAGHIEMLTGQPAVEVGRQLACCDIPRRGGVQAACLPGVNGSPRHAPADRIKPIKRPMAPAAAEPGFGLRSLRIGRS